MHTSWKVLHTSWKVLHTSWKVLHTSWKVLHTFVEIRTTLINSAIIMRSRHGTNSPRKQDVKKGGKGGI
jgi:hypothetical protein